MSKSKKAPTRAKEKKKLGAPSMFTEALGEEICRTVAITSIGLQKLCDERPHWPRDESTIYEWRLKYPIFGAEYTRAQLSRSERYAEEIVGITDTAEARGENPQYTKLRTDARRWVASRLLPKKYGDRVTVEGGAEPLALTVISTQTDDPVKAAQLYQQMITGR